MNTYMQIRFPDTGHTYQLPTQVVADHMAAAGGQMELPAWAIMGMKWSDLSSHALLVDYQAPERDMLKALAKEVPAMTAPGIPGGDEVVAAPVELLLSAAAVAGRIFTGLTVTGPNGTPGFHLALTACMPEAVTMAAESYQYLSDSVQSAINTVRPTNQ